LATAVHRAVGTASVTVHLSVDFLSMARAGEWVIGTGRVTRKTKDLAFVEGVIRVGEREVVRGTAIFKLMRKAISV
jgi:acyl-coenzyme A thioesterase PaaI-like protein